MRPSRTSPCIVVVFGLEFFSLSSPASRGRRRNRHIFPLRSPQGAIMVENTPFQLLELRDMSFARVLQAVDHVLHVRQIIYPRLMV